MSTSTQHPLVFISYSWSGPKHEDFVVTLAQKLFASGVTVRLDKFDLKEGQDKFAFMESMVTDPGISKVLVICDAKYRSKANARAGGVGTETQIISAEIYGKVNQDKFIPIVAEYDEAGEPCLPTFMASRIFIDLSNDEVYGEGFERLLRVIYDRPKFQKPELGLMPAFLSADATAPVPVLELQALRSALESSSPSANGLEASYLKAFLTELSKLKVNKEPGEPDDMLMAAIEQSKPLRDQFDQYINMRVSFGSDEPKLVRHVHDLLERMLALLRPPMGVPYGEYQFDVFRFLGWEFMLLTVAALLRERAWIALDHFCQELFVFYRNGTNRSSDFSVFDVPLRMLDDVRNQRLKLGRVSIQVDLLHDRITSDGCGFVEVMQADAFMSLRSLLKNEGENGGLWYPRALLYLDDETLPLFTKAASGSVKQGLLIALGLVDAKEFSAKFEAAAARNNQFSGWRMDRYRIDMRSVVNAQALAA